MARKKKEESHTPPPTPEKQNDFPSGWCMTDHHSGCKYQFDHGKCGCWCHKDVKLAVMQSKGLE